MVVLGETRPQSRPGLAVLGGKDADGTSCDLHYGGLVRVLDDGLQVAQDLTFGQEGLVLVV